MVKRADDYAKALRELAEMEQAGKIEPEKAAILRAKLYAESVKPPLRWWRVAIFIALLTIAFMVLTRVVVIIGS